MLSGYLVSSQLARSFAGSIPLPRAIVHLRLSSLGKNIILKNHAARWIGTVTLKLEGSLVGVWVKETEAAWRSAKAATVGRPLDVDLRAVDRVDHAGVYLLALLRQRGVRLVASGTAMAEIVRTIEKEWPRNEGESI
jgi:hypothetical protein